jgi:hypothetical protein
MLFAPNVRKHTDIDPDSASPWERLWSFFTFNLGGILALHSLRNDFGASELTLCSFRNDFGASELTLCSFRNDFGASGFVLSHSMV